MDFAIQKGGAMLEACNKWNLSISLAKRFWGRRKVDYLGHQISIGGSLQRSGIAGQYSVSSDTAIDAVIPGKPKLLQSVY